MIWSNCFEYKFLMILRIYIIHFFFWQSLIYLTTFLKGHIYVYKSPHYRSDWSDLEWGHFMRVASMNVEVQWFDSLQCCFQLNYWKIHLIILIYSRWCGRVMNSEPLFSLTFTGNFSVSLCCARSHNLGLARPIQPLRQIRAVTVAFHS